MERLKNFYASMRDTNRYDEELAKRQREAEKNFNAFDKSLKPY
jgi:hypothetical protein